MRNAKQLVRYRKRQEKLRMRRKARRLNIKKYGYPYKRSGEDTSTLAALMGALMLAEKKHGSK